jgi:putative aldouronate transport system substrate-binding protein
MTFFGKIVIAAVFSLFSTTIFAGGNAEPAGSKKEIKIDTSKFVTINMTVYGKAQTDKDAVLAVVNKYLKEKINAEISIENIAAKDALTKYKLYIASGTDVDMMHGGLAIARILSKLGGLAELDGLLEKYTPQTFKSFPPIAWEQAKVDGKTVIIPLGNRPLKGVYGIAYREDLRKKYNVPEIVKYEDFGPYFEAISKNEKSLVPYFPAGASGTLGTYYLEEKFSITSSGLGGATPAADGSSLIGYNLKDKQPKLVVIPLTEEYGKYIEIAKTGNARGYWNRDSLTNTTLSFDLLIKGVAAAVPTNNYFLDEQIQPSVVKSHPEWEIGYYYSKNIVLGGLLSGVGTIFRKGSDKLERALMAFDLLENDDYLYKTVIYGIKGTHFKLDDKGFYVALPEGIESTKHPYLPGYQIAGAYWNDKLDFPRNRSKAFVDSTQYFDKNVVFPHMLTLDSNIENITSEIAAVSDVMKQYAPMVALGMDADKLLVEYKAKLKTAGVDKILAELQKQVDKHYSTLVSK